MASTSFLLDTTVLSEIVRVRPDAHVRSRFEADCNRCSTSVISVMEMRFGAARAKPDSFWTRIESTILQRIDVVAVSLQVAERAGVILADLERKGTPIGVEDVLIGATALDSGHTLVTRNVKHFTRIPGLRVESWWAQ